MDYLTVDELEWQTVLYQTVMTIVVVIFYDRCISPSRRGKKLNIHERQLLDMIEKDNFVDFQEYLKSKKPDQNFETYIGKSIIQHCIVYDHGKKFIEYIIQNSKIDVDKPDKMGRTALFEACYLGKHSSAKLLLLKGADWRKVNANLFGFNCLHACLFKKKYMCLLAILRFGVKVIDEKFADELKRTVLNIENQYKDLKITNLIDDKVERLFDFYVNKRMRITSYFHMANKQIDYVNHQKNLSPEKRKSDEEKLNKKFPNMKYKTLLGKIPKYAQKEITLNELCLPNKRILLSEEPEMY